MEALKALRRYPSWPAVDNDAKHAAVRLAIARLQGAPAAEHHEDETAPVQSTRRPHSWDGVKPTAGNIRPALGSERYHTLLDRKTEHVERGIKAALAFKKWADSHKDQLDEDADLAAVFALSEDFRIQAMCLD
jgi:hypothetical protein